MFSLNTFIFNKNSINPDYISDMSYQKSIAQRTSEILQNACNVGGDAEVNYREKCFGA